MDIAQTLSSWGITLRASCYFIPEGSLVAVRPQSYSQGKRPEAVGSGVSMKQKPDLISHPQGSLLLCSFWLSGICITEFCQWMSREEAKMKEEMTVVSIPSISLLLTIDQNNLPQEISFKSLLWKCFVRILSYKIGKVHFTGFCSIWQILLPVASCPECKLLKLT